MEKEPKMPGAPMAPEGDKEKMKKITADIKEQIKAGKISLEYGDHGHFDSFGYHGKIFVAGKDKLSMLITNISTTASEDPDYLPSGESWKYVEGPTVELTTEETDQLVKKIDEIIKFEFNDGKEDDSFMTCSKISDAKEVLTGKKRIEDADYLH